MIITLLCVTFSLIFCCLSSEDDMFSMDTGNKIPEEKEDKYGETTYSTLTIVEVTVNTTGDYKCQFTNDVGANHAIISLQSKYCRSTNSSYGSFCLSTFYL